MALYLDVHRAVGLTPEAIARAHAADVEVQRRHGVTFLRYWLGEEGGRFFCLVESPSAEAAAAVHREAHGLAADEITEVREGI
jgi:hypothetical protein